MSEHPYLSLVGAFIVGRQIIAFTSKPNNNGQTTTTASPNKQDATTKNTDANKAAQSTSADAAAAVEKYYNNSKGGRSMAQLNNGQFPDVSPLAYLTLEQRTGIMSPVMSGLKTRDVRGEPQGVRNQKVPVETSFLKNPRATEAQIDELDVKNLRKGRAIEY
ncbi:MAG TPA: hypothetical protein V6C97_21560 [Oculatellaceae cyanobacterium]